MDTSFEVFDGKQFSDLLKDIYDNTVTNKNKINGIIDTLKPYVNDLNDAVVILPVLREFLDIGVKNDEQLIKMASVVQRLVAGKATGNGPDNLANGNMMSILSEEEKKQLLEEARSSQEDVKELSDTVDNKLLPEAEKVVEK